MADPSKPEDLKREADDLRRRIEELRRKTEMPINSALGSPKIDAENADGRRDLKSGDEDEE